MKYTVMQLNSGRWAVVKNMAVIAKADTREEAVAIRTEKEKADAERRANAKKAKQAVAKDYPAIFAELRDNLVNTWNEQDARNKALLKAEYEELGYRAFTAKHGRSGYDLVHKTEEEIAKENKRNAEALILNLWRRVKEKVGTPTEYKLHLENGNEWEGVVLNGYVTGTDGTATVESILAGGYNIQKLHIRTLVK